MGPDAAGLLWPSGSNCKLRAAAGRSGAAFWAARSKSRTALHYVASKSVQAVAL